MIIVLDESGDLGFDFTKKKTTHFFVISLLVVDTKGDAGHIRRAVERTLRNKVRHKRAMKKATAELKGAKASLAVRRYFWKQVTPAKFRIVAIALNKRRVNQDLRDAPDRLYNYLARFAIDRLALQHVTDLDVIIDKSKNRSEMEDFNRYLTLHLKAVIAPHATLDIDHSASHEDKAIQAADMFAWGISRKHEKGDTQWYDIFKCRIAFERVYLP